jgi:hypothetical protein
VWESAVTATLTATAPDDLGRSNPPVDDIPRSRPRTDGAGRVAQDLQARGRRFETCRAHESGAHVRGKREPWPRGIPAPGAEPPDSPRCGGRAERAGRAVAEPRTPQRAVGGLGGRVARWLSPGLPTGRWLSWAGASRGGWAGRVRRAVAGLGGCVARWLGWAGASRGGWAGVGVGFGGASSGGWVGGADGGQ